MLHKYISYSNLERIVNTQKPYRGRERQEYPYFNRNHGHKYFTVDTLDGEKIFRIYYGDIWKYVTKEEFNNLPANKIKTSYTNSQGVMLYMERTPREMGIVRPDNSFEFKVLFLAQSEMTLFNTILVGGYLNGYMQQSSRHGGAVFRSGYRNHDHIFYPIVQGMRVDIATMSPHEAGSYKIVGRRVNRKAVKDLLGKYKDMFRVSETMMKSMTAEDYISTSIDTWRELKFDGGTTGHENRYPQQRAWAAGEDALNKSHMLDAFFLFSCAHNVDGISHEIIRAMFPEAKTYWYLRFPKDLYSHYTNARRAISKYIYQQNKDVMTEVEFKFGTKYPASEWGYSIWKNGVEIEQY